MEELEKLLNEFPQKKKLELFFANCNLTYNQKLDILKIFLNK
jgi:hypothetical protein